jgi:hypothetical protein
MIYEIRNNKLEEKLGQDVCKSYLFLSFGKQFKNVLSHYSSEHLFLKYAKLASNGAGL